ncbi:hypothetical protein PFICI_06743 [Pestalotiopsis fici W106-1]|uniref:Uncharacterized protein n=1 Tax=Pestalotiopsis fici (strain W106-1 / CGMCC3.15140) TaxID=1229662 RepID=W3X9C0_PESFW|nr:uncharacterized protein PFICI_06743 [Pestalotiopsis fici W106-1]ETS81741.1 hypothetical protein PFICI_06743 [Pestalotiopsis fici W106-1]
MDSMDIDTKFLEGGTAQLAAVAIGILLHLFVFRIGEWDLATTSLIVSFFGLQLIPAAALSYLVSDHVSFTESQIIISRLAFLALGGIFSSMLVYRAFFHRLSKFPGPFLARLSNFYVTSLSAKDLHLYEEVQDLHRKYGDIVRLGPSELSITNKHALAAIHGAQSPCTKGPWYNVLHPLVSLQMIRNKPDHIKRRRVWDRGFSANALRQYEPRVQNYTNQLMEQLSKRENTPVNVTDWFNFYSFDVMGDLAWGKSFNMLRDGIKHYFMKSLHADMTNVGLFSHLIWLFPIFKATPILNKENKKFWAWVSQQVNDRKMMKPSQQDVFSSILEHHESQGNPSHQDELNLVGDAYLIAVAGSDTTAAALTCMFFELSQNQEALQALQKEVDDLYNSTENVDAVALQKLQFMDGVINESLRLHPPVPSGVQRMTPPEGLRIDQTFIPGNTIIQIPSYTMYRDERFFSRPNEFIPTRWTTEKELNVDDSIFNPFSSGRYSCIGKQLGLMELRAVASRIVRKYNVSLAPGQDPQAFLDGKRDTFTLALGSLELVFTPRSQKA